MRRATLICALTSMVVGLGCAPRVPRGSSHAERAAAADSIRVTRERGLAAFNAGRLDEFMAVWPAEDVVVMVPGAPPIVGKPALRAFLEKTFAGARIEETLRPEEQVVAGDWAFERFTFSTTVTPRGGGAALRQQGKAVDIYRRQPDGSWKVARSILNYDS